MKKNIVCLCLLFSLLLLLVGCGYTKKEDDIDYNYDNDYYFESGADARLEIDLNGNVYRDVQGDNEFEGYKIENFSAQ